MKDENLGLRFFSLYEKCEKVISERKNQPSRKLYLSATYVDSLAKIAVTHKIKSERSPLTLSGNVRKVKNYPSVKKCLKIRLESRITVGNIEKKKLNWGKWWFGLGQWERALWNWPMSGQSGLPYKATVASTRKHPHRLTPNYQINDLTSNLESNPTFCAWSNWHIKQNGDFRLQSS